MRESHKMVKGNFFRMATLIIFWVLLVFVAALIINLLLKGAGGVIISLLGNQLKLVVPFVAGFIVLLTLVVIVATFAGFAGACLIITHLYLESSAPVKRRSLFLSAEKGRKLTAVPVNRFRLWSAVIVLLIVTLVSSTLLVESLDLKDRKVAVTAHRGSSRYAPENTLSAIKRAVEDGADYAEIDVQETADGQVVLFHDTDLKRIAGVDKKIWEISYAELKTFDAGSWFAPEFKGERIPTLQQAIELAKGKIKLNIELKYNGHAKQLEQRVHAIIRRHQFEKQCVVSSLDFGGLKQLKGLHPDLKTGLIIFRSIGNSARADVDFLSLDTRIVNRTVIKAARKRLKGVHVWTVNDPTAISYFIDLGVDNIITDVPDVVHAVMAERSSLSDVEKVLLIAGRWLKE
jgi:glycerophosphoryl diester phosphodiesterase